MRTVAPMLGAIRTLAVDLAGRDAAAAVAAATKDLDIGFVVYCAGADPHFEPFLAAPACSWPAPSNAVISSESPSRLEQVLARTRDRGFDVDWTTPALTQAAQAVGTLPSDGLPAHVREITEQLLAEFTTIGFLTDDDAARKAQPVATIAAPVFDHRRRVALIVAVHPLQALTRRRIDAIGRRMTQATTVIAADLTSHSAAESR
jgi:hypothetical protein